MSLANCPFCGAPAQMKTRNHVPSGTEYVPQCTDRRCIGRTSKIYLSLEAAEAAWNTRFENVSAPAVESSEADVLSGVQYWRCKVCGSLHRNHGRTYVNSDGDVCCDACHTPVTADTVQIMRKEETK